MTDHEKTIKVRQYGSNGAFVIVLHGGPAAPGYMKPVAKELAHHFRILEPFQRDSSDEPLNVARHIQDLRDVITHYCPGEKPLLVGHSWGAMLALMFAALHPDTPKAIVMIGSGTFDTASRKQTEELRQQRVDEAFRQRLELLEAKFPDPGIRLAVRGGMYQQLDSVNLIRFEPELQKCDAAAHQQTWDDAVRLQNEGVYPQAFTSIRCPVLMLHGDADPHPGLMIRDSLKPWLPQLEYLSWPHCGHYPWLEKAAHEDFYQTLTDWLQKQSDTEAHR